MGSDSTPTALRATYRIEAGDLSLPHEQAVAPYVTDGPCTAVATLGPQLIVEHTASARRVVLEPTSLRWMLLVGRDRVAATGVLRPRQIDLKRQKAPMPTTFAVGRHRLEARRERWRVPEDGWLDVTWAHVPLAPAPAAQAFARMLLPSQAAAAGLIAEVAWWDGGATDTPVVRLTLTDLHGEAAEVSKWREPDPHTRLDELERDVAPLAQKLQARSRAHRRMADLRRREVMRDAGRVRLMHQLRSEGQHFAWITSQPFLDKVRAIVNAASGAIRSFRGDGEGGTKPMHLDLDWWGPLSRALSDTVIRETRLAAILLTAMIVGGKDLPSEEDLDDGLDEEERGRWEGLRQREGPAGRVYNFIAEVMPGERRAARRMTAMAGHEMGKITAPREYVAKVDGAPLRRFREEQAGWIFEVWDFDMTLTLGNPLVHQLTFEEESVRLVLELDAISFDCQWQLSVGDSAVQIGLQLFTFGLWGVTNFHYGYGAFTAENLRVALDLVPDYRSAGSGLGAAPRSIEFEAHVVPDETRIDYSLAVTDANPVGFGLTTVLDSLFATLYDATVDDVLVAVVNDQLGVNDDPPLIPAAWPDLWRAVGAPPPVSAVIDLHGPGDSGDPPGFALWEGDAAYVWGGARRDVDGSLASPTAIALSPEYLAAWLRNTLGTPPYQQILPSDDALATIGVELPPPGEIEDPDPPDLEPRMPIGRFADCGPPPAPLPPQSEYRLSLRRLGPGVILDPPGERMRAGRFQYEYRLSLVALRTYYRPVSIVQQECVSGTDPAGWLGPGAFGGPGPEPGPAWQLGKRGISRGWAARSGLRVGMQGLGVPGAGPTGVPGMGQGGFPIPGEPHSAAPFDFGGRSDVICAYSCGWHFDPIRVNLGEPFAANVTVTGDLIVDFDPTDLLGSDGGAMFTPLRISIASDADYAPDVEFELDDLSVSEPFTGSEEVVGEYLLDVARSDAAPLLTPAVVDDRVGAGRPYPFPVLERGLIPPKGIGVAAALLQLATSDSYIQATADFIAGLIVHRQSSGTDSPRYVVRNGMVYWQIDVSEDIAGLL